MTVYKGLRIFKDKDYDIHKGDVGWLPSKDLPEVIVNERFLLSEVKAWRQRVDLDKDFWKDKREKIHVEVRFYDNIILIESLEKFDKIMEDYLSRNIITIREQ